MEEDYSESYAHMMKLHEKIQLDITVSQQILKEASVFRFQAELKTIIRRADCANSEGGDPYEPIIGELIRLRDQLHAERKSVL